MYNWLLVIIWRISGSNSNIEDHIAKDGKAKETIMGTKRENAGKAGHRRMDIGYAE